MAQRKFSFKTDAIAAPSMWARRGHHKRVVFLQRKDKKGRTFVKTPGGLTRLDFMRNKRNKIVSKKLHLQGKKHYPNIRPYVEARSRKITELGAIGMVKAKANGTEVEIQVYMAMLEVSHRPCDAKMEAARGNLEKAKANPPPATLSVGSRVKAPKARASRGQTNAEARRALERSDPTAASSSRRPVTVDTDTDGGDDSAAFAPGDRISLSGLQSMPQFNGKQGVITSYGEAAPDGVAGRYAVRIIEDNGSTGVVHVKASNMSRRTDTD